MTRLIEVQGLSKKFGPITAVDDLSFTVDRGELLGILGPNDAGKNGATRKVQEPFFSAQSNSAAGASMMRST